MHSDLQPEQTASDGDAASMKLALAIALVRSKLLKVPLPEPHPLPCQAPPSIPESDAEKWKRKAKERKKELQCLKNDLKEAGDDPIYDLFPSNATCKCYFFDNLGKLTSDGHEDDSDQRFFHILKRRFLRHVQLRERIKRRRDGSTQRQCYSDCNSESEMEQLKVSVDFLVELCGTVSPIKSSSFSSWSHQAVDSILALVKTLSTGKHKDLIEGIICNLIVHLLKIISVPRKNDKLENDLHYYVQHVIRKLGKEPYIGQRVLLSVSQRISVLAESLLLMDPFDDAFPRIHCSMYLMMQLIEFLVSDYLRDWCGYEDIDLGFFENWVTSVLHARKQLELLENQNTLYVIYMDRVIGNVAKQVGETSASQKLNSNVVDKLFL